MGSAISTHGLGKKFSGKVVVDGGIPRYSGVVYRLFGYTLLMLDVIVGTATLPGAVLSLTTNLVFLGAMVWLGLKLPDSEKVVLCAA